MLTDNSKSLTMKSIGDHKPRNISSTLDIENCSPFQSKRYRMKISALDLDSSYPNLETLELSDCCLNDALDFFKLDIKSIRHVYLISIFASLRICR